jgi:hypothetical protein
LKEEGPVVDCQPPNARYSVLEHVQTKLFSLVAQLLHSLLYIHYPHFANDLDDSKISLSDVILDQESGSRVLGKQAYILPGI